MDPDFCIVDALSDPKLKTYFLNLLASDLSNEEKYESLLDFFRVSGEARNGSLDVSIPLAVENGAAQQDSFSAAWDMDGALSSTLDSIRRAVLRMKRSQHRDGGWGPRVEESTFWHTAHVLICLLAARRCPEIGINAELDPLLQPGFAYLEHFPEPWATDTIPPEGSLSVYDLCLMVRCFFRGGREFLRRETAVRIYRGIERLYHSQNVDGGWDACLWGYAVLTPTRLFSEVGATSAVMSALAEVCDDRFLPSVQSAGRWFANTQNLEGSWNDGSTRPDLEAFTLTGDPRISKTCDALQGILALQAFDLPVDPYRVVMTRAVDWLRRREMPVLDKRNRISGWGWGYSAVDYESTCLALETLLQLPNPPLPLLAANALWLVQNQRRQEGDVEDGCWVLGHTARITTALIAWYKKIQALQKR